MHSELDTESLQTLLLRTEVVNISVGQRVRFTEHRTNIAVDNLLREFEQLIVVITHHSSIDNMIVIPAVVVTDKHELTQFFHVHWLGIDHLGDVFRTFKLPTAHKQIRVHFDVKESQSVVLSRVNRGGW